MTEPPNPLRLFASLSVPLVVLLVLPWLIRTALAAYDTRWATQPMALPARVLGVALALAGAGLFAWCVWLITNQGRGTIMPWDPSTRLVVRGPYRHVRNPMISAVLFLVSGQALIWGSWLTGALALFFFLVNHFYFIYSEEPGLEQRFGESYRHYKAHVPRWLPRRTPWPNE